jgi:hypothetical protein
MKPRLEHYLISIPVIGGYMHSYVMTNNQSDLPRVFTTMLKEIEQRKIACVLSSLILQTHLTTGWKLVRNILKINGAVKARAGEIKQMWKSVEDFHLTMWVMPDSDPDHRRLMDLH